MVEEVDSKREREDEGDEEATSNEPSSDLPPAKKIKPESSPIPAENIKAEKEEDDISGGGADKLMKDEGDKEGNVESSENNNGEEKIKEAEEKEAVAHHPSEEEAAGASSEDKAEVKSESSPADIPTVTPEAPDTESKPSETPSELSGIPGVPSGVGTAIDTKAVTTVTNPESMVEESEEISAQYIGRVIGKGGEMIRDLQARSGCRMDVDQNVPHGNPRILTYRGTRKTVDLAKQMVSMLCTPQGSEANLPLGEATRKELSVPATSVGKIIGRGGEMIRELQSRSQAKLQVDHTARTFKTDTRSVSITGTSEAVRKAEEMVMFLVANPLLDAMKAIQMLVDDKTNKGGQWGSGPPYLNMQNQGQNMTSNELGYGASSQQHQYGGYQGSAQANQGYAQPNFQQSAYGGGGGAYGGGSETEVFPTAKMYMGRIIGQKGVTINDLQKRSGCDIQINQDVPPGHDCLITMKGVRQGIESAKQMLREIIEMGPNHPYAGGGGQFRANNNQGYQQQQPMGHMQQQQAPHMHAGYQAPQEQQMYGQQQHYGQPPPQQQYGSPPIQQQQYGMPQYQSGYLPQQQVPQQQQQIPQAYGAPPPRQHMPVAVSSWKTATAADGQVYYYNEKTGETQWDKPAGMP
mmetsp:Transcript_18900/g.27971  ORF Transcript_18900/g.27971 Transcript_18900/m.27971 type:complete len:634 (-) Transcript_18900:1346-3247(-)|eukprot:CAMPEP_0194199546 /NCGR_PEP_ID=MMETSP0156-20130528/529_1 /TAXON_ID=33649 /ORGANISM="Thalassionema nitzschioides, Strain L26-B" /LENGTH=633 /DNA_ID=CAMNT_0038924461 /DNA_START=80 /DNA_END=1981 /DNA_ORIENTATION=+